MKHRPGVILGSGFNDALIREWNFVTREVKTQWGRKTLYVSNQEGNREMLVAFRHELPHALLPNQINYRALIDAFKTAGCTSLLLTSSVGVLADSLPLYKPLLLNDLLMLDNRLPDGSACTFYSQPEEGQGHLVINDGLFSSALNRQLIDSSLELFFSREVTFAYVGGPRTKTTAENQFLKAMGGHVNSMTLGPEVVLANEREIPCVGIVSGHKPSNSSQQHPCDEKTLEASLQDSGDQMEAVVRWFLKESRPVKFGNMIYRFN